MKAVTFASALLLAALSAPLEAKSFAWCQVNAGKYQAYLSDIVEIDDGPDAYRSFTGSFAKGFRDYVQTAFDQQPSSPDCTSQESRFYAEDYIEVLIKTNPGFKFVRTGWHGSGPTAAADIHAKGPGADTRATPLRYRN
jgi:hypothetical protein